jgi:hypothetical protein
VAERLEGTWQRFHTDADRAEAHDLAPEHPDEVQHMVQLWFNEAGKYVGDDAYVDRERALAAAIARD